MMQTKYPGYFLRLDMDGVSADFEGWAFDVIGPGWKSEIDKPNWGKFADYPRLYKELPVLPHFGELFGNCVSMFGLGSMAQLTALPSRAAQAFPMAGADKIRWSRENVDPELLVGFGPFAVDKQLHVRSPREILIDDTEININQWNAAGGIGILYKDLNPEVSPVPALLAELTNRIELLERKLK